MGNDPLVDRLYGFGNKQCGTVPPNNLTGRKSGTTFPGSEHDSVIVGRQEESTVHGRNLKKGVENQIHLEPSESEKNTVLCGTVPGEEKGETRIYKMGGGREVNNLRKNFKEDSTGQNETARKLFVVTEGEWPQVRRVMLRILCCWTTGKKKHLLR